MKGNELADALENAKSISEVAMLVKEKVIPMLRYQQASIDRLLGSETKTLTDEDKSMLIRTLKWSEDLLRIAGNDEAVSDVQDCLMILRKAQEK